MLSSKQRAYLRGMANGLDTAFYVGKKDITPTFTEAIDEHLEKREIVKIGVQNNCESEPADIAEILRERTKSEIVQIIGKKILLYRQSKNKPILQLPR